MTQSDRSTAALSQLNRIGGRLCLDFVNTVGWRLTNRPNEWLQSYSDLVTWSVQAGVLGRARADELRRLARRKQEEAASTLARSLELREALYVLLDRWRQGRSATAEELRLLNQELDRAPGRLHLRWQQNGFVWEEEHSAVRLERVIWPIVWSASDLLTTGEPNRLKLCAGEGCGWVYLDESRNRSRRWCSMSDCGNREKARRHYARSKGPAGRASKSRSPRGAGARRKARL
jgi:predicted RNA-binding Zn ribbon-like protein